MRKINGKNAKEVTSWLEGMGVLTTFFISDDRERQARQPKFWEGSSWGNTDWEITHAQDREWSQAELTLKDDAKEYV